MLAVASVTTIMRTELQRLLSELVSRSSMQQVVDAACRADLARFEDPKFHDRLHRAIANANIRPLQMTVGLLAVASSALGVVQRSGIAADPSEPLFFVLGVVAAVPLTLTSLRRACSVPLCYRTNPDRPGTYIHPEPAGGQGPGQGGSCI